MSEVGRDAWSMFALALALQTHMFVLDTHAGLTGVGPHQARRSLHSACVPVL